MTRRLPLLALKSSLFLRVGMRLIFQTWRKRYIQCHQEERAAKLEKCVDFRTIDSDVSCHRATKEGVLKKVTCRREEYIPISSQSNSDNFFA